MDYTENYHLPNWAMTDRIRMEDFNDMTDKIDAALKKEAATRSSAVSKLNKSVAKLGNCKIVYGSYTGTGKSGEANPCTLTFDGRPLIVFVLPERRPSSNNYSMILMQGIPEAFTCASYPNSMNKVTWQGNSVQWYYYKETEPNYQLSVGVNYYVALIAMDA